jgi:hypothetical protein
MTAPSGRELALWSQRAVAFAKGEATDADDFVEIGEWGASEDQVKAEVSAIAKELGIQEVVTVRFENPEGVGHASAWWNAEEKTLGINSAAWEKDPGWKRLEIVAHEVMHAHQTLCHDDWQSGWARYVKLAGAANDVQLKRGSDEFWQRQWKYQNDSFEAEAMAFGREYRDRRRKRRGDGSAH